MPFVFGAGLYCLSLYHTMKQSQVHSERSGFHFQLNIKHFFSHLLDQKSKYKMGGGGCCKQTLKPLFVWAPLFDRKAKWTLQGQKKLRTWRPWVRFNFQKVSNLWNGFFIFRSGEVKNIKNRVFKSHKKVTKAIKQSQKQGSHWKGVTPVDRRRWNLPPQCTTVRVTWGVGRLVTRS